MTCAMGGIPGGGVKFLPLPVDERNELDPNDFRNVEGLKTPFCDIDAVLQWHFGQSASVRYDAGVRAVRNSLGTRLRSSDTGPLDGQLDVELTSTTSSPICPAIQGVSASTKRQHALLATRTSLLLRYSRVDPFPASFPVSFDRFAEG